MEAIDYLLRPEPTMTLAKLREEFSTKGITTVAVMSEEIRVDVEKGVVGGKDHDKKDWEAPLPGSSLGHLANWLGIPRPFLEHADPEEQQFLLERRLGKKPGEIVIDISDGGIQEIRPSGLAKIDPRPVIDVASRVVGDDAIVLDGFRDLKEYRFDVVVRDGSEFIGGDQPKARQEGDLTKGGLRFGQNTQSRLAPWVNTFLYRLVCTNGMEIARTGAPVEMRGRSQEEVIEALEAAAMEQMALVNHQIESFYDLRNKKVDDPYALIRRLSQEGGYPARVLDRLEEHLPIYMEPSDASMFDVVNLITNQANHQDFQARPNARRQLEVAGGSAVHSHSERCPRCQGAL